MKSTIKAALPFPLRLEGEFVLPPKGGAVTLRLETRRHEHFDERIAGGGRFDLEVDRAGWASYTYVSAQVETVEHDDAMELFLEALNSIIENLREELAIYWIRRVERSDLFALEEWTETSGVVSGNIGALGGGRSGGMTLPVKGLTPEMIQILRGRIANGSRPAGWRVLELDALDALETGRYEDAVILAWTAVETAVKTNLPRLARGIGLSLEEFSSQVGFTRGVKPYSYEQAVEQSRDVHVALRLLHELSPQKLNPVWVSETFRFLANLRNEVVHLGVRIRPEAAYKAVEDVSLLFSSLSLESTQQRSPFDSTNWREKFGEPSSALNGLLTRQTGKLVLYSLTDKFGDVFQRPFETRHFDDRVDVTIPSDILPTNAETLLLLDLAIQDFARSPILPVMQASPVGRDSGTRHVFSGIARLFNRAAYLTAVLRTHKSQAVATEAACDYYLGRIRRFLNAEAEKDTYSDDGGPGFSALASRIAPYFLEASSEVVRNAFRSRMKTKYRKFSTQVELVAEALDEINPADSHTICSCLRSLQSMTWSGNTIVACPIERTSYWPAPRAWQPSQDMGDFRGPS